MYYPDDVIEEVRSGNDIVKVISSYIQLKQRGAQFFGLCPFHTEKTPSFCVNPDKQMFYCFSCGTGGNVYTFIMQMENIGFPEAIKKLADEINYSLPETSFSYNEEIKQEKNRLLEINKAAARFFYDNLKLVDEALDYVNKRGISRKMRVKFGLGYALPKPDALLKDLTAKGYSTDDLLKIGLIGSGKQYYDRFQGRLMFPIFDYMGNVVGFGGRVLEKGEPKYLNSPDSLLFDKSKNLYGINYARKNRSREIILVEGYMDVIALFEAGFENAVAALGTAFNIEHAKLLKRYCDTVIILFDSDTAGKKATLRAIPILNSVGLVVKVMQLTDAKDPDEFIKEYGAEQFGQVLKNATSHISYQVSCLKEQFNLENIGEKVFFTQEVAKLLGSLSNAIERDAYIKEVAKLTDISAIAIKKEIETQEEQSFDNPINFRPDPIIHTDSKEKADFEAKKRILLLIAKNNSIYGKIKTHLSPEDFADETFAKLLKILFQFHEANRDIFPAELLNYFEIGHEQNLVTEIFSAKYSEPEPKVLEKELNDIIKTIKCNLIDKKLSQIPDADQLKFLLESKINIKKMNINFF